MKPNGFGATLVLAVVLSLSGCTLTRQMADAQFEPPKGPYKLIVLQPDIAVSVQALNGLKPHPVWTTQARENVLNALQAQQSERGGNTNIATTSEVAGADPALVADLIKLHGAVGASIQRHKYSVGQLPTKENKFDWTLGAKAVEFGAATNYDYALFLRAHDSFASGGLAALQFASFATCFVQICYVPPGGEQVAFASLVDLKTGKVVWFNTLRSDIGDIRSADGASKMVSLLLDKMKPGKELQASTLKGAAP
jgi:hypothetical protein